jgi:import receptor subunit TOM70
LPLINRAVLEMRRSDAVKAEECCRKALEIDPHCDLGYNQLAQVLLAQDRIQEAVNVYNDSVSSSFEFMI